MAATAAFVLTAWLGLGLLASPAGAGDGSGELPPPSASPEDVRQQADDILDQRQFQRPEPNPIEQAEQWVQDQLGKVFGELTTGSTGSVLGWAILVGAVGLLVFFLLRLGRSVQADPRSDTSVSVERTRTADQWREDAEGHERDGAWKAALRSRFRALVADLVELGRVDDVPGRTAGEYRVDVADAIPAGADAFAEATRLFEDAWYGDLDTGPDENARFRDLADSVVAEARRRRASEQERELVGAAS